MRFRGGAVGHREMRPANESFLSEQARAVEESEPESESGLTTVRRTEINNLEDSAPVEDDPSEDLEHEHEHEGDVDSEEEGERAIIRTVQDVDDSDSDAEDVWGDQEDN